MIYLFIITTKEKKTFAFSPFFLHFQVFNSTRANSRPNPTQLTHARFGLGYLTKNEKNWLDPKCSVRFLFFQKPDLTRPVNNPNCKCRMAGVLPKLRTCSCWPNKKSSHICFSFTDFFRRSQSCLRHYRSLNVDISPGKHSNYGLPRCGAISTRQNETN